MNAVSSAGVVVVGNEILSGKVEDLNGPFLARELRACGVRLGRVVVVPDDPDEIAFEVERMAAQFNYVLTSGGVGATHDDVTLEGVARAFRVELEPHPDLIRMFVEHTGAPPTGAAERLTRLPAGATLIQSERRSYPLVCMRNVYIFPGVPRFLREKFDVLRPRLSGQPFHLRRIFVRVGEPQVAEVLAEVDSRFESVDIGSYPKFEPGVDHMVEITLESRDPVQVQGAFEALDEALDPDWIVRKE